MTNIGPTTKGQNFQDAKWDNTPLFVKYNPGLLKLASLLGETG